VGPPDARAAVVRATDSSANCKGTGCKGAGREVAAMPEISFPHWDKSFRILRLVFILRAY
jgi:hypothetical protein